MAANNPMIVGSIREGDAIIEHRILEDFRVTCTKCNAILGEWEDWQASQITLRVHNNKVHPDATGN